MARLKQCLPEALKVASAHRFLWRHVTGHASTCLRSGGFLRSVVEDLEAGPQPRLISIPWRRKTTSSCGWAALAIAGVGAESALPIAFDRQFGSPAGRGRLAELGNSTGAASAEVPALAVCFRVGPDTEDQRHGAWW